VANKRNKKRQQRARRPDVALRPTSPAPAPAGGDTEKAAATAPATPAAPRPASASRYAGTVSGPRRGPAAAASTGTIDIDERVPYFAKDLRRILVTAGVMVVIIIGASLLLH
jgi:hypothetical protein